MATKQLFLEDSYLKEAKAKVIEVNAGEKWIELDATIFYPEGGGQESDSGSIEFKRIKSRVKAAKKEAGRIKHFIEGLLPEKGAEVKLFLDWERRHSMMRMHSAQHLLSAIILDLYGASTAGNQIHEKVSRMDFHPIKFSQEMLEKLKQKFDEAVRQEKEIRIYWSTREKVLEEVEEKRRRLFASLPESVKDIRVVEIEDYDKCPCAGTHVKNTVEIGFIKILGKDSKGKDKERISFELSSV
ncbi:MAG: alanyl-tRNA editing protein [Candidatus Diapherotrites archaeon]